MASTQKDNIMDRLKSFSSNADDGGDDEDSCNSSSAGSRSHAGVSTTSGSHTDKGETSSSTSKEELAKKETAQVFRLRVLVILVLVLTAAAISYTVYRITSNAEAEEFKDQYEGAAEKILASFEHIIHMLGSVASVGVSITTHSINNGQKFPFVTLPNFESRAGNARHMSGALFVGIAPIVTRDNFEAWDEYIMGESNFWMDAAVDHQDRLELHGAGSEANYIESRLTDRKVDLMHFFDAEGRALRENSATGPYLPMWQTSPFVNTSGLVNENILHRGNMTQLIENILKEKTAIFSGILKASPGTVHSPDPRTALFATLHSFNAVKEDGEYTGKEIMYYGDPFAELYIPVFDSLDREERNVVAILVATIQWEDYLRDVLPNNIRGLEIVIDRECGGALENETADQGKNGQDSAFTFAMHGEEAHFLGYGDLHQGYDEWMRYGNLITDNLDDGTVGGVLIDEQCSYDIHIFPTKEFESLYRTTTPAIITVSISAVFVFTICMFFVYDMLVERRQKLVLATANKSTAIVSSLFPKNVRDRLMEIDKNANYGVGTKTRMKGFLAGDDSHANQNNAAPIADLFPYCTVFFGDIANFTAWSSTRDPAQVFTLLQSVYQKFDMLAKRRRVFKVETIGDCYMAVAGVPEPQEKHALTMVRFAWDCLIEMNKVTRHLECTLGPDTADLSIRIGLHSGSVTAGVLRGDRARFQLFGDTVNTASRMESTGHNGKIQVSEATAQILREAGKEHWLTPRRDQVQAKGKGYMQTYWANPSSMKGSSVASGESTTDTKSEVTGTSEVMLGASERLVEWVVDLLVQDIKKILHARVHCKTKPSGPIVFHPPEGHTCLDEIKTAVRMPEYNASVAACRSNHDDIIIPKIVMGQLRDYVSIIASMYRNNPFHNFEHACHVTMSVKKLLKRVVTPELTPEQLESIKNKKSGGDIACHIHEYTYGINSEPLALVALTFAALIHDVDHRGVSNVQMMQEEPEMGERYRGKSVAEQNSLDLAWALLMEDRFEALRRCLFLTQEDLMRFRQLIVNIVLATDIFDKDLNSLRRNRWDEAFADKEKFDSDLRATIVLEHIIQASDVSHTMQHWQVYQKWNKRLFMEMHAAFRAGRLAKDPSTFWYKGELGFFDNYIIPLAGKLESCGVFGVSSDEYLNYALQNRAEWAARGEEMLLNMMAELNGSSTTDVASPAVEAGE